MPLTNFKNLQVGDRFLANATHPKYGSYELAINAVIYALNQAASFTPTPPMYAIAQFSLFPVPVFPFKPAQARPMGSKN